MIDLRETLTPLIERLQKAILSQVLFGSHDWQLIEPAVWSLAENSYALGKADAVALVPSSLQVAERLQVFRSWFEEARSRQEPRIPGVSVNTLLLVWTQDIEFLLECAASILPPSREPEKEKP